ncbi:hypothetical protein PIGHUM_01201 [Pigmentiphaga humi]|uniref:Uncharacterized protein n=1 Tax=Pigmentiphaga humi TaxID=2478468 RepID=A0A3P4AZY9_9BURK|nr:choice-of-anchor tandem repeat GloVer-containing protein [Pigmentiphaga humi]VCU69141.1 hypothetical protein PIGHUM_01201 [Pigmentiphaga humi]
MKTFSIAGRYSRCLPLLLALAVSAGPARAALPSVDIITNFTGSQPGGGNGSLSHGTLTEGADGYLYGRSLFGGGTEANMQDAGGLQGGRVPVFYRLRNDGSGFEVLSRNATVLPVATGGWLAAGDGYLYGPSNNNGGVLLRYLPGGSPEWTFFGPNSTVSPRADVVAESLGRFIVGRTSNPLRALSMDGATVTTLAALGNVGASPIYMVTDTDGTVYGVFSTGGGNGRGSLFRLSADGAALKLILGFDDNQVGGYFNGPYRPIVLAGDYIYGVTYRGPLAGGVFWRIRKDAAGANSGRDDVEILHSFGTGDVLGGNNPDNLILGRDGHIYGITQGGATLSGAPASGAIFRYRIGEGEDDKGLLEVLHTFSRELPDPPRNNIYYVNGAPVASPINLGANAGGHTVTALAQASNGQFYGLTSFGGSYGWGTLFRFNPGDEVEPGSALTPVQPQVIFGINSLDAGQNRYTLAVGGHVSFYWRGVFAAGCVASSTEPDSPWNGPRPQEGNYLKAERIDAVKGGTWQYTLTCEPQSSEYTEPVSATVTVEVVPEVADAKEVGNGGGAFGWWSLLPLLMAWGCAARHRRRAC